MLFVAGVNTLLFHRCRAGVPTGQYFTIDECSVGQVINIQSAVVGFSARYNPDANPPQCPWHNCTRPTDVPATLCNGRRSCRISQQILIYPQGSALGLCPLQRDANFIRITFTCITGICIVSLLHVSYVIISCIIIKCENCFLSSAPHLCRGKTGILITLVSISLPPSVCVCVCVSITLSVNSSTGQTPQRFLQLQLIA